MCTSNSKLFGRHHLKHNYTRLHFRSKTMLTQLGDIFQMSTYTAIFTNNNTQRRKVRRKFCEATLTDFKWLTASLKPRHDVSTQSRFKQISQFYSGEFLTS
jgi:hypothetical protein